MLTLPDSEYLHSGNWPNALGVPKKLHAENLQIENITERPPILCYKITRNGPKTKTKANDLFDASKQAFLLAMHHRTENTSFGLEMDDTFNSAQTLVKNLKPLNLSV